MDSLSVTIHSRKGIVYAGSASSVSGKNRSGPFDVLPLHANFVTNLSESVTVMTPGGQAITHALPCGLLWARGGSSVDIYIGIGE